jgi:phytol kinase
MFEDLTAVTALPLWFRIILVPTYVGAIVVVAEVGHRWRWFSPEQSRKIVHIGTGNIIALAWWLQLPAWVGITSALMAGAITLLSYWLPILPGVNSVGRKSYGTFFYAVSMGLAIAIFWPLGHPEYATLGILVMAWGDGLAAIIGQRWGRHPYQIWGNTKSLEGTATLMVVSYLVTTVVLLIAQGSLPIVWVAGIPVAIAAVILESISQFGIDNITLPLGTAALAFWLVETLPGN